MHAFMENQLLFLPNAKGMIPYLLYWLSPIEYTSVLMMQTLSFVGKDALFMGTSMPLTLRQIGCTRSPWLWLGGRKANSSIARSTCLVSGLIRLNSFAFFDELG